MSEIGRKVCISKSNMTSLIDKLVEEGLVERSPYKNDRRVINISITALQRKDMNNYGAGVNININRLDVNYPHYQTKTLKNSTTPWKTLKKS